MLLRRSRPRVSLVLTLGCAVGAHAETLVPTAVADLTSEALRRAVLDQVSQ